MFVSIHVLFAFPIDLDGNLSWPSCDAGCNHFAVVFVPQGGRKALIMDGLAAMTMLPGAMPYLDEETVRALGCSMGVFFVPGFQGQCFSLGCSMPKAGLEAFSLYLSSC